MRHRPALLAGAVPLLYCACVAALTAVLLGCGGPQSAAAADWRDALPGLPTDPAAPLPRRASATPGTGYLQADGGAYAVGDVVRLGSQAGAGPAFAVYLLPLGGADPAQVYIDVFFDLIPTDAGDGLWVGLGDYSAGRWEWHGPYTDSPLLLDAASTRYASPGGNLALALVAYGGDGCCVAGVQANPVVLEVGAGTTYTRIEDAYAAAAEGAVVLVHPLPGGAPYTQPAVQAYKPSLAFRGVLTGGARVKLDGTGYNYTGAGSTPRAVFQFNPGADGCSVAGFEIYNASNDSYNGASVRINQANNVSVRDCAIHDCDMGIMSNGTLAESSAQNQVIEYCTIFSNGNLNDPGYNHNLYLGGTSVTLRACEVYGSLTGHNVKSRAHFNRIEYCYVHDSANREFDLVDDSATTAAPGSDSVLIGNVIVKDPACSGNRAVIQFGQDGGNAHQGTLYLVHNTIATPFLSPVAALSATGAGAQFWNNIIWDMGSGQSGQQLAAVSGGALAGDISGGYNWLSAGQVILPGTLIDNLTNYHAAAGEDPPFADATNPSPGRRDFRLSATAAGITDTATPWTGLGLPTGPGQAAMTGLFEFLPLAGLSPRVDNAAPDRGAFER